MRKRRHIFIASFTAALLFLGIVIVLTGKRAFDVAQFAQDSRATLRFLVESEETVGEVPLQDAVEGGYLDAVFGDNPDLLGQLKNIIDAGLSADPSLSLGEVAALIVTYYEDDNGDVSDIVVHGIGSFSGGEETPGMHRDGYMRHALDHDLWSVGNSLIKFTGREIIMFADSETAVSHRPVVEGILFGDILPLANTLTKRLNFSIVFPDPRNIVPPQLKKHVQAVVVRGYLEPYEGELETMILTASPRAATYALSLISDTRRAAELTLKSRFDGVLKPAPWKENGTYLETWWAYEMAQTLEQSVIEKEGSVIRVRAEFGRTMVNAVLKAVERAGRDMRRMNMVMGRKLDPRLVDAQMDSTKPANYWGETHRWGPNWPIAPQAQNVDNNSMSPASDDI